MCFQVFVNGDLCHFCLQGRPYIDKMKWDRVEMLYWLQEERKQHALDMEARSRNIPLSMVHLEPITPQLQTNVA